MTELYVDDRSWLLTGEPSRHRFGPLDAPLLVLNDEDEEGCLWWADLPDGWDAPEASTPIDDRPYGDGGFDGDTSYGPRTLSFGTPDAGFVACPDRATALRAWRRLLAVASSRTPVLYTAPDVDGDLSLWLRASGRPNGPRWVDDRSFEFSFVMVAPDPFRFDARQAAVETSTGLPEAGGGLTYPIVYPFGYGVPSASQGTIVVVNAGDEDGQARYVLRGPLQHPAVVNETTGVRFSIGRDLDTGDVLTVDTKSATVVLNGVSIFVDFAGSFPLIVPGTNTLRLTHEGPYVAPAGDASTLTVSTASTWK